MYFSLQIQVLSRILNDRGKPDTTINAFAIFQIKSPFSTEFFTQFGRKFHIL